MNNVDNNVMIMREAQEHYTMLWEEDMKLSEARKKIDNSGEEYKGVTLLQWGISFFEDEQYKKSVVKTTMIDAIKLSLRYDNKRIDARTAKFYKKYTKNLDSMVDCLTKLLTLEGLTTPMETVNSLDISNEFKSVLRTAIISKNGAELKSYIRSNASEFGFEYYQVDDMSIDKTLEYYLQDKVK